MDCGVWGSRAEGQLSSRPYPTCCMRRGVPNPVRCASEILEKVKYLGEGHVGDDDLVQCRRGILLRGIEVTTGVVLVLALTTTLLPRLAVGCLGDGALRGGAGGGAGCMCERGLGQERLCGRASLQKCHPARPKMPLMMARRTCISASAPRSDGDGAVLSENEATDSRLDRAEPVDGPRELPATAAPSNMAN